MKKITTICLFCAFVTLLSSCQSTYYGTMEVMGKHKRDLLVSRVEAAREEQAEAKTEFKDALTQFAALVNHDGGDLRKAYDKAREQHEDCRVKARNVNRRIASIEEVGTALFKEWDQELDDYGSDALRQKSQEQLNETKVRYGEMLGAMKRASSSMDPVLLAFNDQVLFLKHNLNAQAVASLRGEVTRLEAEISSLLTQMEQSIAEADQFIRNMGQNPS